MTKKDSFRRRPFELYIFENTSPASKFAFFVSINNFGQFAAWSVTKNEVKQCSVEQCDAFLLFLSRYLAAAIRNIDIICSSHTNIDCFFQLNSKFSSLWRYSLNSMSLSVFGTNVFPAAKHFSLG